MDVGDYGFDAVMAGSKDAGCMRLVIAVVGIAVCEGRGL